MLSSRWLCSRCLGLSLRTAARPRLFVRFQSTTTTSTDARLSPIILDRAHGIAAEHARLSAQNADDYDVTVAKRIGELSAVTSALREWQNAQNSLQELEALSRDPSSDDDLRDLAAEDITSLNSTIPTLTSTLLSSLIPAHPFAQQPALLEFHPGAGGSEASLFAHELLEMYTALLTRLRLPHQVHSYVPDDNVSNTTPGLTSAILECSSANAYDLLRSESGVHRVQRIPSTEKKGRTHTSAVSILVLPSLPETDADNALNYSDPNSDYYISPTDVRSETMRARGAGGQHVNKTDSAVRLTHIPTGLVVAMQDSRSQHKNREKAWSVLRAKIAGLRQKAREDEIVALRRKTMGGVGMTGREDKVRTYNFSQSRVTDHRSGWESMDLDGVLAGAEPLEALMDSVRAWLVEREVQALVLQEEEKRRVAGKEESNGNGKG